MIDTPHVAPDLAEDGVPAEFAAELLQGAPEVWLHQPPSLLSRDVRFCYPPPAPGEARASVRALPGGLAWTVWVVSRDRRGLLAAATGALAANSVTIRNAVAAAWPALQIALLRFQVSAASPHTPILDWAQILADLRAAAGGTAAVSPEPGAPSADTVRLAWDPLEEGRGLLTVFASDRPGLLWTITSCLDGDGCDIELASIASTGRTAQDLLVVTGTPDLDALGAALAGPRGSVRISPQRTVVAGPAARALHRLLARSISAGSQRTQSAAHRMALRRSAGMIDPDADEL